MLNTIKFKDFFNPDLIKHESIHIIGVGAIGSHVAEQLARIGTSDITLYDFDTVSDRNVANQLYDFDDVGQLKVDALAEKLKKINPKITITKHSGGYQDQPLSGYVFLCADNIDLRRDICTKNKYNRTIVGVFDFRMGLTDAQHYAAKWENPKEVKQLLSTMDFTHEEAVAATPVSPCGTTLSICPTVKMIVSLGIANFINMVLGRPHKATVLCESFLFDLVAFDPK